MTDYPPTEYDDWQRARGHMTGEIQLRSLEQARAEIKRKARHQEAVEWAIANGIRLFSKQEILELRNK